VISRDETLSALRLSSFAPPGLALTLRVGRLRAAALLTLGLLACLWTAALAFGGTLPLVWSAVEFLALLLMGALLWSGNLRDPALPFPWKAPALLLLFAALQSALVRPPFYLAREQFLRLLVFACAFCIAAALARDTVWRARLIYGFMALGLFEAVYGLVQSIAGWQWIFTYKKIFYTAQATGTYINPNHFAGLLELIFPFSLVSALQRLDQLNPHSHAAVPSGLPRSERLSALLFYSFATLLLFAGILLSRSRMGLLSVTLAALAMGLLWLSQSARPGRILPLLGLLAATVLFSLWLGLGPLLARYSSLNIDFSNRLSVWKDSVALIRSQPLLGTGLGTFADSFTRVQSTLLGRTVDHAHNDYLEFAVEWGLPGAALLFGLLLWLFVRTTRASLRPAKPESRYLALACSGSLLALLVHSLADFNLQIPANALLFSVILGLAASLDSPRPASAAHPLTGGAA